MICTIATRSTRHCACMASRASANRPSTSLKCCKHATLNLPLCNAYMATEGSPGGPVLANRPWRSLPMRSRSERKRYHMHTPHMSRLRHRGRRGNRCWRSGRRRARAANRRLEAHLLSPPGRAGRQFWRRRQRLLLQRLRRLRSGLWLHHGRRRSWASRRLLHRIRATAALPAALPRHPPRSAAEPAGRCHSARTPGRC